MSTQRQWPGNGFEGGAEMVAGKARGYALHRSRQSVAKRLLRELQFDHSHDLFGSMAVRLADRSSCGDQSLAGGIQHDQAAWIAGRYESKTMLTAMVRRKYDSTTEIPNSVSGPKISDLPATPRQDRRVRQTGRPYRKPLHNCARRAPTNQLLNRPGSDIQKTIVFRIFSA